MYLCFCFALVAFFGGFEQTYALPPCTACITSTRTGLKVTQTLLYHSYYTCKGTITRCIYNTTELNVCTHGKIKACYNPHQNPSYYTLEIRWKDADGPILAATPPLKDITKPAVLNFDACNAINRDSQSTCGTWEKAYRNDHKYMCPEGATGWRKCTGKKEPGYSTATAADYYCPYWECVFYATWNTGITDEKIDKRMATLTKPTTNDKCQKDACNPLHLRVHNPHAWKQGYKFGLRIAGGGTDPGTIVYIRLNTQAHKSSKYHIHNTFYEAMHVNKFEIPHPSQNLFLELAGAVVSSLKITDCYFCGGTQMGDQWPWEAQELNYSMIYNQTELHKTTSEWVLAHSIVGRLCYARTGPQFTQKVGQLVCLSQKYYNATTKKTAWWSGIRHPEPPNPLARFPELAGLWTNLAKVQAWQAPPGLYWICGNRAYAQLPPHWGGACVLGTIRPSFFLLNTEHGEQIYLNIEKTLLSDFSTSERLTVCKKFCCV